MVFTGCLTVERALRFSSWRVHYLLMIECHRCTYYSLCIYVCRWCLLVVWLWRGLSDSAHEECTATRQDIQGFHHTSPWWPCESCTSLQSESLIGYSQAGVWSSFSHPNPWRPCTNQEPQNVEAGILSKQSIFLAGPADWLLPGLQLLPLFGQSLYLGQFYISWLSCTSKYIHKCMNN